MESVPSGLFRGLLVAFLFTHVMRGTACVYAETPPAIAVDSRDQLLRAVERAVPGTDILIAPGQYRGGLTFDSISGTKQDPIVLAAADRSRPPTIVGGASGLHLRSPRYVELRDLEIVDATGNGLNVDDGGGQQGAAVGVVLSRVAVRRVGPNGNRDGIKLSGVDDFRVVECEIEQWGDGGSAIDMVGCHDGEILGCRFRYRNDVAANGVQAKGGSARVTIRHCRFENAGSRALNLGGSTGQPYFRPQGADYEARDLVVEDCTIIGSMAAVAFVGVDGAVVRHNTIYRPRRWVLRILQESRGPRFVPTGNVLFENNLIAFQSDEVRSIVNLGTGTAPETFVFRGNHWFCSDDPSRCERLGLPTPEQAGVYGVDPKFRNPADGDLRMREGPTMPGAGAREPD